MDQTKIKRALIWFCRITLLSSTVLMAYLVLLPQYNFSHWMPHGYLKSIGTPYSFQLWLDHNLDKLAHFLGAFFILIFLYGAKFFFQKQSNSRLHLCTFITMACILGAEIAQKWIDRGFSYPDIFFGTFGVLLALFLIKKTRLGDFLN